LPQQVGSVRYLAFSVVFTTCCGTLSAHEVIYDVKKERSITTAQVEINWDRLAFQICNIRESFM